MKAEVESDESFWLERELIERGAFLDEGLFPAEMEFEPEESTWDENELTVGETFPRERAFPAAYEMMEFLESDVPTMFVDFNGKSYLLRKEEYV